MKGREMKNSIIKAFLFRHACKKFDSERKIPEEEFDVILESARLSPSSFGFEPWKFLVVQDMDLREKLLTQVWGAGGQFPTASHVIIGLVKKSYFMKYDSDYLWQLMTRVHKIPEKAAMMRRDKYEIFQRDDFKLLDSERTMEDWAAKQTYIALGNMMTVAALMGIDSCPIEGFNKERLEQVLAAEFSIDTSKYAMGWGLALGYRVNEPRAKTRQSREEVVCWY
jgi:nitroreductase